MMRSMCLLLFLTAMPPTRGFFGGSFLSSGNRHSSSASSSLGSGRAVWQFAKAKKKVSSSKGGTQRLVVVESPAKARTIQKFLDQDEYIVDFCLGHVRDLARQKDIPKEVKKADPQCKMGIDVANDFEPIYVNIAAKADIVRRLKASLEGGISC